MLISAFQGAVSRWMRSTFNKQIEYDMTERGDRLVEEVFELLQSRDYPLKERIPLLLAYVDSRPKGEPSQELGGVMVTTAAYAHAAYLAMEICACQEILRCWEKQEIIREKQKSKPKNSPLPE